MSASICFSLYLEAIIYWITSGGGNIHAKSICRQQIQYEFTLNPNQLFITTISAYSLKLTLPIILTKNKTFTNGSFWLEKSYNFVCKKDGMRSARMISILYFFFFLLMFNMIFCLLATVTTSTIFFAASFKRLENNFRSRKPLRRAVCQNNTRCDWRAEAFRDQKKSKILWGDL